MLWCCRDCVRLVYLQIFRYGDFEKRANEATKTSSSHPLSRPNAESSTTGRARTRHVHSVDSAFVVPTEIPDLASTISLITRITKDDPQDWWPIANPESTFCWVARKASAETIERLRSLNLQGIYYQKESKRFYPKRELAAQVLGYVGTDDEGLSGIEREYNDQLRGKPGRMLISVDARSKWFGRVEKQPDPGAKCRSHHRRKHSIHCRARA